MLVGAPPSDTSSLVAAHESRLYVHEIRAVKEMLSDAVKRMADIAARDFWWDTLPACNALGDTARALSSVAQLLQHAVEVVEIRVQNEQMKPPQQKRRRLQVEQTNQASYSSGLDAPAEGRRPDAVLAGAPPSDTSSLVATHESRLDVLLLPERSR